VTVTGFPAAEPFYDARRGVCYAKPVLRGWLHLVWFGASLVLGPLLLARAEPGTATPLSSWMHPVCSGWPACS
jgi:hypothetical protein